jgi:hypothetical protein
VENGRTGEEWAVIFIEHDMAVLFKINGRVCAFWKTYCGNNACVPLEIFATSSL